MASSEYSTLKDQCMALCPRYSRGDKTARSDSLPFGRSFFVAGSIMVSLPPLPTPLSALVSKRPLPRPDARAARPNTCARWSRIQMDGSKSDFQTPRSGASKGSCALQVAPELPPTKAGGWTKGRERPRLGPLNVWWTCPLSNILTLLLLWIRML
eukprot:scaffold2771_cov252-Pinguiococcus_pyrenoidosus.AAC.22